MGLYYTLTHKIRLKHDKNIEEMSHCEIVEAAASKQTADMRHCGPVSRRVYLHKVRKVSHAG